MLYLAADTVIGRALREYGEFAESENQVMASLLRPGDTVVDVGANIGTVTLALAGKVGPGGVVHAFEPQRFVFTVLCANLALNGLTNVHPHRAALGRAPGRIAVPAMPPDQAHNFGAVSLGAGEPVALETIDSLGLETCRLIKLDVEGMEYDVLLGAGQTIGRCHPAVYFEAKKNEGTRRSIAWLKERGYRLHWHFAAFFSAGNLRGRKDNVFGNTGDINALALPAGSAIEARLPRIDGPDADWKSDYARWGAAAGER